MFQVNPLLGTASQRIHMKKSSLFSLKDKSKQLKCHLLQFLFGALRLKIIATILCLMQRDLNFHYATLSGIGISGYLSNYYFDGLLNFLMDVYENL